MNKEKMGSSSFNNGLPCGVVICGAREDGVPKKPADCFWFVASFFSFLVVFSISGSNSSGVPVRENIDIQTINNTVSLKTMLIY